MAGVATAAEDSGTASAAGAGAGSRGLVASAVFVVGFLVSGVEGLRRNAEELGISAAVVAAEADYPEDVLLRRYGAAAATAVPGGESGGGGSGDGDGDGCGGGNGRNSGGWGTAGAKGGTGLTGGGLRFPLVARARPAVGWGENGRGTTSPM